MIELKNVDKKFRDIQAADHITASVREGMIFGLVGSNGAGKSTLLRMICGVIKPDSGEVLADGAPVYENPDVKSQICFLSDSPYYFANADIEEMRDYYMTLYPSFDRKLFDSLVKKFGLEPKRKISSFSKGMKKQVSILLGLCAKTKYLLCDETFDGLDPVVRQAVKSLFASEIMNRDFTPVISSHNLRELEDICDSVGLLHRGKLLHPGAGPDQGEYLQAPVRDTGSAQRAGDDQCAPHYQDGTDGVPADHDCAGPEGEGARPCAGQRGCICGDCPADPGGDIYQRNGGGRL